MVILYANNDILQAQTLQKATALKQITSAAKPQATQLAFM